MSLHNSSSPGDPQACWVGGMLLAGQGDRQLPLSECKELGKPGGKQLQGHQTASGPQSCPRSDPKVPAQAAGHPSPRGCHIPCQQPQSPS